MTRRTRVAALTVAATLIPTSTALAGYGDRPLEKGDRGTDVKKLQRVLKQLGQKTSADGVFGAQTRRAVLRYERTEGGGDADGVVEPDEAKDMLEASRKERGERDAKRETDAASGENAFPVQGDHKFGDGFGADRGGRSHQGSDIFAKCGTPVVTPGGGEVSKVAQQEAAGNYVVVDAGDVSYVFMHLQSVEATEGATLKTGDAIGAVGETGNAQGCHLHFEIWDGGYQTGTARDPEPDLKAWDSGQGETPPSTGEPTPTEPAPSDDSGTSTTGTSTTDSGSTGGAGASSG